MHPNEERILSALTAFATGDRDEIARFLSPQIVWHVGGDHQLSGDYTGLDAVLGYHARVRDLTGGSVRVEPGNVMADDTHGGLFVRVVARRGDRTLDTEMAEALRFDDEGRWTEYWALAEDQPSVDVFWKD